MTNHCPSLTDLFQALADPTRRGVVERLAAGPASVSELAAPFGLALPSFVRHLRVLEQCGLIRTRKEGRVRTCTLAPEALATPSHWLEQQRRHWSSRLDQLDAYLVSMPDVAADTAVDAGVATSTESQGTLP